VRLAELIDVRDGPGLSVGVIGADLLHLGDEVDALATAGVELLHVDVIDGVFCPGLTAGSPLVRALPGSFAIDVHLMVDEPLEKVDAYLDAGARILSFHVESTRHPHRVLQRLAGRGVVRGVALNPGTPLAAIEPLLDELELVLILAVNPGWPGQSFIPATASRLAQARTLVAGREIALGVDGGVTRDNARYVASLGADLIVAGSAVFDGDDPTDNARFMLRATGSALTTQSPRPARAAVNEEEFDG
jgi:ribulose-phosphate 3-epimerase